MTDLPKYELEREFAAPIELVWRAWTDGDLFSKWYGPNCVRIVHSNDLKIGGEMHYEMQMGGNSMFQILKYTQIDEPKALSMIMSSADKDWNIIAAPHQPNWPRKLLTEVSFVKNGDKTQLRLLWTPYEANADELAFFAAAIDQLGMGWNMGMKLLSKLLEDLQK